jgi:hypothetical protein
MVDVYTVPVILQDGKGKYYTVKVILGVPGQRLAHDFNPGQVLGVSGTSTARPVEEVIRYLVPNRQHLIILHAKRAGQADLAVPWINNFISVLKTYGPAALAGDKSVVVGIGSQIRLNGSAQELSQ